MSSGWNLRAFTLCVRQCHRPGSGMLRGQRRAFQPQRPQWMTPCMVSPLGMGMPVGTQSAPPAGHAGSARRAQPHASPRLALPHPRVSAGDTAPLTAIP